MRLKMQFENRLSDKNKTIIVSFISKTENYSTSKICRWCAAGCEKSSCFWNGKSVSNRCRRAECRLYWKKTINFNWRRKQMSIDLFDSLYSICCMHYLNDFQCLIVFFFLYRQVKNRTMHTPDEMNRTQKLSFPRPLIFTKTMIRRSDMTWMQNNQ